MGKPAVNDQGSIYIGTEGVLYSPYIAAPVLLPAEKFKDYKIPKQSGQNHYLQFVEACRGNDKTSTPFSYAGLLTESVLLGWREVGRIPGGVGGEDEMGART